MRKWGPLLAICLGTFMLLIDVTIVTVALPSMADDLQTSFSQLQWVLDGYALALAALVLGAGSMGDRFGHRRVYLLGLLAFGAASACCALAPNATVLIASRVVQGIGGAAMLATTIALLTSSYSGRDRGVAFGVWGAVSGAAAAAGPIVGGLLTEYLSWPTIFLVNLPLTVITVILTLLVLADSRNRGAHRLDLPGMATFTVAAGATTYALIRGDANGWASTTTLGTFGVAAAALLAFLVIERSRRYPMLDLALFRRRTFVGLLAGATLLQAGAFGYLAYTSMWLQSMLGDGPVRAGLVGSLALSATAFVVSALAGRFLHAASPTLPVGIGLLLVGAGDLLQANLSPDSTGPHLIGGLIVAGAGAGLALPPLSSALMSAVPRQRAGMAGGALNAFRQLGLALGIAVLGVVFRAGMERGLGGQVPHPHDTAGALAGGQAQAVLAQTPPGRHAAAEHLLHGAFATGLNSALLVAGLLALLGGALVLALVRRPAPTPAAAEGASERAVAGV